MSNEKTMMTDEEFDAGLKGVMGSRFHGLDEAPTPASPSRMKQIKKIAESGQDHVTPAQGAKIIGNLDLPADATEEEVVDALCEELDWTWLDKIRAIVKGIVPFAAVSLGCFWGIQTSNMTGAMGWPIIYFCTAAVAFIIGRYARK